MYKSPCFLNFSVVILLGAFTYLPSWVRADEPAGLSLDPKLHYRAERRNPVTYDVDFAITVTAPYHTKKLQVWLPLPQTDVAQEVEEGEITAFPMQVKPRIETEKKFGNKFAFFEFDHPEGAQIIRHTFKIKVWELDWGVESAKVVAVKKWSSAFDPYLKSDAAVHVDDRFESLVKQIVPEKKNEADDFAAVMDWLNANMKYDHAKGSLKASSEHALTGKTGHCSDYHGLCAAFGRALGYPTRVTYGINAFPKNSPSHCKIEAFLPPYGWVSFDVSETQKLLGEIRNSKLDETEKQALVRAANARLRRGFRDNTWFLQTRGTDYDLAPPAAKRVNVVRTIYAEADGVALPDPDPANPKQNQFSWMTAHRFTPDRPVSYPFKGWKSLQASRNKGK